MATCAACGATADAGARFCGGCGAPLANDAEPASPDDWWRDAAADEPDAHPPVDAPSADAWPAPTATPEPIDFTDPYLTGPLPPRPVATEPEPEPEAAPTPALVATAPVGAATVRLERAAPNPGGRDRRLAAFIVVAIAVILLGAGGIALVAHQSPAKSDAVTSPLITSGGGGANPVMPAVTDFTLDQAKQALQQAGINTARIHVAKKESVDHAPNSVLDQFPPADQDVGAKTTVTLTIAAPPATMPNYVGLAVDDATAKLQLLGITPTIVDQVNLSSSVRDDSVVSQSAVAGSRFTTTVALTVARAPVTTVLTDLETSSGDSPSSGDVTIGNTTIPHSASWGVDSCDSSPIDVVYDLGGHYRLFVASAGLTDDSTAFPVTVQISVDNAPQPSQTLAMGVRRPISIDVSGHQQLEITITGNGDPNTCDSATAALGDAKLLSLPGDLPTTPTT